VTAELVLFYAFAALALFAALAMVTFVHNVVASALSLVVTMVSLAGVFVLLGAEFIGVVQIIVYAGAIMVLLLFVVMLLDQGSDRFGRGSRARNLWKLLGCAGAVGVAALLATTISGEGVPAPSEAVLNGGYRAVGLALFREFVLVFEVAGLLLLAAIVGAVILAKGRVD